MGTYNPSQPQILGEEWVPIREEDLIFNQVVNNVELGTTFTTDSAGAGIFNGRFYINQLPDSLIRNQVWTMAIYNRGEETESGPIRRVVLPVDGGAISGTNCVFRNCTTTTEALFDPSDRRYIEMALGRGAAMSITLTFSILPYAQLLSGKRILGVNFLYGGELLSQGDEEGQIASLTFTLADQSAGVTAIQYPSIMTGTSPTSGGITPFKNKEITRIALGDTNMFFNPTTGVNITQAIPWTYAGLSRLDASLANTIEFHFDALGSAGSGPSWTWDYCGLEIIYCEEKRIAFGSSVFQYGAAATTQNYRLGYNNINLYTLAGTTATLLAGNTDYIMTISQGSLGDSPLFFSLAPIGAQPELNALRELYPVEPQVGIQLNIPAPPTEEVVGEVFTSQQTPILPQLSLHSSSYATAFNFTHSYGRQSVGQVYGSKFVSQRIDDSVTTPITYTKARFYARRFGHTTIPLQLTGPSSGAFINPNEFDELDPIIDGWKEITLDLVPPVVMGSTGNPTWTWTATGETAGNRWEVLGAVALSDAITAAAITPTSILDLGVTTYGAPISGSQIYETWMPQSSPAVSGSTIDTVADVAVYFSAAPPAISGMSVVTANQPLSGIGTNCGVAPEFIPTALQYNQITWNPNTAYYIQDLYNRTVATGWGTATSGQTWSPATSTWGVTPGAGRFTPTSTIGHQTQILDPTRFQAYDTIGYVEIASTVAPSGSATWAGVGLRSQTTGNIQSNNIAVQFNTDSTVSLVLLDFNTVLATTPILRDYVLGTKVKLRWSQIGSELLARIWYDGTEEPDIWHLNYITASAPVTYKTFTARASRNGATAPVPNFLYSNLYVANANNGYVELQRRDQVTDWQTIMKMTNMGASGFKDYEARIGLSSDYRIRYVNKYGFEGPWSATVSNTIPAPGVTATSLGADDEVFVFTTNEHQDGSSNLAYSPAWMGQVQEDFAFPESAGQVYQTMYGRDYVTVFRPSERGGTNFSRNVLVQAAAISPPTLEDFTGFRDMAWADVSYICVRDADGNRWLSNVSVPSGSVMHYRKLYMAPFNVVQVTDTPSPVDPSWLD